MQQAPPRTAHEPDAAPRRPRGLLVLRWVGWVLMAAGVVVALYVVYALFFTDLSTERDQGVLLEQWEAEIGDLDADDHLALEPEAGAGPDGQDAGEDAEGGADEDGDAGDDSNGDGGSDAGAGGPAVDVGDAVAVMAFYRPGSDERPVNPDPLAVVDGVSADHLQRGPGHYPDSAMPGEDGNFAVAGHRVTYGRPFFHLDEVRPGDQVHVWDRAGDRHVYEVTGTEIVKPHEGWVLGDDPQDTGQPTLTLTTCHPRFSLRERMIMFAELVG